MSQINIPLGQLGSQLYVRKLSGIFTTGYHAADPNAQWTSGIIAKLASDSNGNAVVTPVTLVTDTPFAMFWCDRVFVFYNPVVNEVIKTDGVNPIGITTLNLKNANLEPASSGLASVFVTTAAGVPITNAGPVEYTINPTNGQITVAATSAVLKTQVTALISYRYQDPNKTGLDQTAGSGKVAVFEGYGEIGTLIYDTSVAYSLGAPVYFTATGLPTTASAGGAVKIGSVIQVPSNSNPELQIKVTL